MIESQYELSETTSRRLGLDFQVGDFAVLQWRRHDRHDAAQQEHGAFGVYDIKSNAIISASSPVCTTNSDSDVLVMQSAEERA
jgi:hypothetical protein